MSRFPIGFPRGGSAAMSTEPYDVFEDFEEVPGTENKPGNQPSQPKSDFTFFRETRRKEWEKKHQDEPFNLSAMERECVAIWNGMKDSEKTPFKKLADEDRKRYDQMKNNKKESPPKRPLSAFFWFCYYERPNVRRANPGCGVGEVAKELGKRWTEADAETKEKYHEMAFKDKNRYNDEMTAYRACGGAAASASTIN